MTLLKKIACIIPCLLMTGYGFSQTSYPSKVVIGTDTVIAITVPQMDVITTRLNACRILPLLDSLNRVQQAEIKACKSVVAIDTKIIDSLQVQVNGYQQLSGLKDEQIAVLNGVVKQGHKSMRRVKLMTTIITIPISVLFGGALGLIIAR